MNRILVIRGGAIGDFVLTLPAIRLLREAHPSARIEILGYKHIAALAEQRFYADGVKSIEAGPLSAFFAREGNLPAELRAWFAGFDLIVSYLYDPDGIFDANVRRCGRMQMVHGPGVLNDADHAARQLAKPLEQIGLDLRSEAAQLYPSAEDRAAASRLFDLPYVALHPGSGSERKNWPIAHWRALCERLHDRRLLLVGGEADRERLQQLRDDRMLIAEKLPLPILAAVLERAEAFVGHDSGISHIAAAVGTKCVLLFGPTDPRIWAPQNANALVLRGRDGNLAGIEPAEVARRLGA